MLTTLRAGDRVRLIPGDTAARDPLGGKRGTVMWFRADGAVVVVFDVDGCPVEWWCDEDELEMATPCGEGDA